MKANKLVLSALALSLLSLQSEFISHKISIKGRSPANAEEAEKAKGPCEAKDEGEKLNTEVKDKLKDKEAVIEKVADVKKEEAKKEDKKDEKQSDKQADKTEDKKSSSDSDLVLAMTQMTTLFTNQMQAQLQMQVQMMDMLISMQNNVQAPYTFDSRDLSYYSFNKRAFELSDSLSSYDSRFFGFGRDFDRYSWSHAWSDSYHDNYRNQDPYQIHSMLDRSPAQARSDFGFDFSQRTDFVRQPIL